MDPERDEAYLAAESRNEGIEVMPLQSLSVRKPRFCWRPAGSLATVGSWALCLALALLVAGAAAGPAQAGHAVGAVLRADEALRLAQAGEIVLVDVRSPQEWRQTGVPAGARRVTIHNADGLVGFLNAMRRELDGEFDRPIAVICAQGNRSSVAQSALSEAGYSQVFNIREGMLGSADGPGWLSRGLPTDDCGAC